MLDKNSRHFAVFCAKIAFFASFFFPGHIKQHNFLRLLYLRLFSRKHPPPQWALTLSFLFMTETVSVAVPDSAGTPPSTATSRMS